MTKELHSKYWICDACAKKQGGVWPASAMGCTMAVVTCGHCQGKNQRPDEIALAPWVDWEWPNDKKKNRSARLQRD